ncbi:MAG: phage tail protein [Lachnospiraceae bacterium]|nr:phage tail protein [Lachnospiraceae bacterium]MDD6657414.1 phage tail protein [Lachnospiraceae bacterium]
MAKYPFKKYNYKVEIKGITEASFSEVSGFDASIDVIEYREGDEGVNYSRKMSGLTKFGNVTLKWGMTSSVSFYEWVMDVSQGKVLDEDRNKDITITLFDDDGTTSLAVWNLYNAWPSKYTAPDFNASSSEIAFESVEIVYESMERES